MVDLSQAEKRILDLIKRNPFVEQSDIAAQLKVARSTVAVHISQLVKKGALLGRGYIMPDPQKVTCIGGIAHNRKFTLNDKPLMGTSNPAKGGQSFGGVARNIAENLARLNMDVSLVSIVGDDLAGQELLHNLQLLGIDTAQIAISSDGKTAEYLAIFDPSNELVMGVASMDIFDELTGDLIAQSKSHFVSSDWVILDCNLPSSAINKVIQFKQQAEFHLAVDTVSISKAKRLPKDLSAIDLLFTNRDEATSILKEKKITGNTDIGQVATLLRELGAQGVVITDGARGHITSIGEQNFRTPAISKR
ncbi:MAG: PfkB family carbohydrate kinase, partial [Pseudomonadota bacterium]